MGLPGYLLLGEDCYNCPRVEILCLSLLRDAGRGCRRKESGGASALGHVSIRHNPWWRVWCKSNGSWSKTAVCIKLAHIKNRRDDTLRAPSVITFMATVAIACKSSMLHIALVKAERINLSYNLMHVFMHQTLLRPKMHNLLLHALARIGSNQCGQLALVSQSRHLCGYCINRLFVRVHTCWAHHAESILLMWQRWGVPVMACGKVQSHLSNSEKLLESLCLARYMSGQQGSDNPIPRMAGCTGRW